MLRRPTNYKQSPLWRGGCYLRGGDRHYIRCKPKVLQPLGYLDCLECWVDLRLIPRAFGQRLPILALLFKRWRQVLYQMQTGSVAPPWFLKMSWMLSRPTSYDQDPWRNAPNLGGVIYEVEAGIISNMLQVYGRCCSTKVYPKQKLKNNDIHTETQIWILPW